jgi:predicted metal-binding membrane protein
MSASTPLETALRHDRAIVAAALVAIAGAAWTYLLFESRRMDRSGICQCFGLAMSGPDVSPWSATAILPLFFMWAEMMVAMMIPSAAPVILTFAKVNRERQLQQRPFVATALFTGGYIAIWTVFSLVAALAQWTLHGAALLSAGMKSTSSLLGGTLLISAGIFQFTHWKRACLAHCRSPLAFLLTQWREGRKGAVVMGICHGAYCTGCCWLLMALLFVAGVMNMVWVAVITVLVLLERVVPQRFNLGVVSGISFAAWGAWMIASR